MDRITRSLFHRWFTKRQEIPFLFTLLFLFFMSGGYLVISVWGNPDSQGAAAALQAPVTPPSLDSSAPAPVADPRTGSAPLSGEPAAAPVETPKVDASTEAPLVVGEPLTPSQELPVALPSSTASVELSKPAAQGPKTDAPAKTSQEKKANKAGKSKQPLKPSVKEASKTEKTPVVVAAPLAPSPEPQPSKTSSAKKKGKKAAQKPEPEYSLETPEGWKWFAAPLGYVLVDGQLKVDVIGSTPGQILASDEPLTFETPEEMVLANAVAVEEEIGLVVEPKPEMAASPAIETPVDSQPSMKQQVEPEDKGTEEVLFQKALAKIERNKEKRALEAARYRVELPSLGGSSSVVPSSLLRLKDAVSGINARAGINPAAENPISSFTESSVSVAPQN